MIKSRYKENHKHCEGINVKRISYFKREIIFNTVNDKNNSYSNWK